MGAGLFPLVRTSFLQGRRGFRGGYLADTRTTGREVIVSLLRTRWKRGCVMITPLNLAIVAVVVVVIVVASVVFLRKRFQRRNEQRWSAEDLKELEEALKKAWDESSTDAVRTLAL